MYSTPRSRIHSSCASRLDSNFADSSAGTTKAGRVSISGLKLRFHANSELIFFSLSSRIKTGSSEIFDARAVSVQPHVPRPRNAVVANHGFPNYGKELAHVKRSGTGREAQRF